MKHTHTRYLRTQERLALGHVKLDTVAWQDKGNDFSLQYLEQ